MKWIAHNLPILVVVGLAILYAQQHGMLKDLFPFTIFPSEVVKQGEGVIPTDLQLSNEILDFDRNETALNWKYKMSSPYYICGDYAYCQYEIQSVYSAYVVKINNQTVSSGNDWKRRTNVPLEERTSDWFVAGSADVKNLNITAGQRHFLEITTAILPSYKWSITSYGGTPPQYNFNFQSKYCSDMSEIGLTEYQCYVKKCGYYGNDNWVNDLSKGKFCEKTFGTCYNLTKTSYYNDCNKCGSNTTILQQVFTGHESTLYCNYDKCFAECYTGGTRDVSRGQRFGCYVQGQSGLGEEYPKNIIGYNYQTLSYKTVLSCSDFLSCQSQNIKFSEGWNYCNYDLCSGNTGAQTFSTSRGGQTIYATHIGYYDSFIGQNLEQGCNDCTIEEKTNLHTCEINGTNPLSAVPTITKLTKDFLVCIGGRCNIDVECPVYYNEMLAAETFGTGKIISEFTFRYPIKRYCTKFPTIVTDSNTLSSYNDYDIMKKVVDENYVFEIPSGKTYTFFYIIDSEGLPALCINGTYDINTGKCTVELGFTYICSQGQFDSAKGLCVVQPNSTIACPEGGRYDTAQNLCIINPTAQISCPSGTYVKDLNACVYEPSLQNICPQGNYDSSLKACVVKPDISYLCLQGTYNQLTNECIIKPETKIYCMEGIYNETTKLCESKPSLLKQFDFVKFLVDNIFFVVVIAGGILLFRKEIFGMFKK